MTNWEIGGNIMTIVNSILVVAATILLISSRKNRRVTKRSTKK